MLRCTNIAVVIKKNHSSVPRDGAFIRILYQLLSYRSLLQGFAINTIAQHLKPINGLLSYDYFGTIFSLILNLPHMKMTELWQRFSLLLVVVVGVLHKSVTCEVEERNASITAVNAFVARLNCVGRTGRPRQMKMRRLEASERLRKLRNTMAILLWFFGFGSILS